MKPQRAQGWPWLQGLGLAVLGAECAAAVLLVLVLPALRITYPFELEWSEGLAIDYAHRIAHHLPIYGEANAGFGPCYYPPLYYFVSLPFLLATHWSLVGPRLVSWLATLGCGVLVVRLLRRLSCTPMAILFALGVAAEFYPHTHYWYDLARVDSLAMFLVFAAVVVLAADGGRPRRSSILLGATLLVAAIFTKQTTLPVAVAMLVPFVVRRDWRRLADLTGALLAVGLAAVAAAWIWTSGAIMLLYTMPLHHRVSLDGLWDFGSFASGMVPLLVLGLAAAAQRPDGGPPERVPTIRILLLATGAALFMGAVTFCKVGGEENSSLPVIPLLAAAAGLAAQDLWARSNRSAWGQRLRLSGLLVLIVTPVLYGAFSLATLAWIPSGEERQQARELWEDMRTAPGPFLPYNYSFPSTVLRGTTYAYADRLYDLAGGWNGDTYLQPDVALYPQDLLASVRDRTFAAIYTDGAGIPHDPMEHLIRQHYKVERIFGPHGYDPAMPRWWNCTPRVKWVPKPLP